MKMPFGMAYFQGRTVSFRWGDFPKSPWKLSGLGCQKLTPPPPVWWGPYFQGVTFAQGLVFPWELRAQDSRGWMKFRWGNVGMSTLPRFFRRCQHHQLNIHNIRPKPGSFPQLDSWPVSYVKISLPLWLRGMSQKIIIILQKLKGGNKEENST